MVRKKFFLTIPHQPCHNKPRTLQNLSSTGGVCGAVSKFGVGMCQAHGIPSAPIAQPGHCAFIVQGGGRYFVPTVKNTLKSLTLFGGHPLRLS